MARTKVTSRRVNSQKKLVEKSPVRLGFSDTSKFHLIHWPKLDERLFKRNKRNFKSFICRFDDFDDVEENEESFQLKKLKILLKRTSKTLKNAIFKSAIQILSPFAKVISLKFRGFLLDFMRTTKKCSLIRHVTLKEMREFDLKFGFSQYFKYCHRLLSLNLTIRVDSFEDFIQSHIKFDHLRILKITVKKVKTYFDSDDELKGDDDEIEDIDLEELDAVDFQKNSEYLNQFETSDDMMRKFFTKLVRSTHLQSIKLDILGAKRIESLETLSPLGEIEALECMDLALPTSPYIFNHIPEICSSFCNKIESLTFINQKLNLNSKYKFRWHIKHQPSIFFSKETEKYFSSQFNIKFEDKKELLQQFFSKFKNLKFFAPIQDSSLLSQMIKIKNIQHINVDKSSLTKRLNFKKEPATFLRYINVKHSILDSFPMIVSAVNLLTLHLIIDNLRADSMKKCIDHICQLPMTNPMIVELRVHINTSKDAVYSESEDSVIETEENINAFNFEELKMEDTKLQNTLLESWKMYQASEIEEVFSEEYRKKASVETKKENEGKKKKKSYKIIKKAETNEAEKTKNEKDFDRKNKFKECEDLPAFENLQKYELKIKAPRHENNLFKKLINIIKDAKDISLCINHPRRATTQSRMPFFLMGDLFNLDLEEIRLGEVNKIREITLILWELRKYEKLRKIILDTIFFEFGSEGYKFWWSKDMDEIPFEEIQDMVNSFQALEEFRISHRDGKLSLVFNKRIKPLNLFRLQKFISKEG